MFFLQDGPVFSVFAQVCLAGRFYGIGWLWWISALWDVAGLRPGLALPVPSSMQGGVQRVGSLVGPAWVESDKERLERLGATWTCWCLGRLNSPIYLFFSGGCLWRSIFQQDVPFGYSSCDLNVIAERFAYGKCGIRINKYPWSSMWFFKRHTVKDCDNIYLIFIINRYHIW